MQLGIGLSLSLPALRGSTSATALSLNFLTGTLDPRITFTRASSATYVNSSGTITSAATNTARFDYNPSTLAALGLLIEEQRTNLFLNSDIAGTSLSTQSVTVAATPYTISFYGTGTITLSGTAVATITGAAVYPARQTLTFTPTAGTLTCTVTGSVQYAQCEAGSLATSFIPTAGATATRSVDVASMTGTNFSAWFNASAGTFVAVATVGNTASPGPAVLTIAPTVGAGFANMIQLLENGGGGGTRGLRIFTAGVAEADLVVADITANTTFKLATAYAPNDAAVVLNGGAPVTDAVVALPTGLATMDIGKNYAGVALNGRIASLTYYNTRKSNSELVVLST